MLTHQCVKNAQTRVVVVDGPADAVKKTVRFPPGRKDEGTVLIPVAVTFVLMAGNMKVREKKMLKG